MLKAIKYGDSLRFYAEKYRDTDPLWRSIKRLSIVRHEEEDKTFYYFNDKSVLILIRIDKNNTKYGARDLETGLENVFILCTFNLGE